MATETEIAAVKAALDQAFRDYGANLARLNATDRDAVALRLVQALDRVRAEDTRDVAEALRDAIGVVAGGRIGQIGPSQVYTPQINVERVEMWREALAGFSGGAEDTRDAYRALIQEAIDYGAAGTPAGWGRRARAALDADGKTDGSL